LDRIYRTKQSNLLLATKCFRKPDNFHSDLSSSLAQNVEMQTTILTEATTVGSLFSYLSAETITWYKIGKRQAVQEKDGDEFEIYKGPAVSLE
jgi:hypothetical protein